MESNLTFGSPNSRFNQNEPLEIGMPSLDSINLTNIDSLLVTYGTKVGGFILLLIATFIVSGWIKTMTFKSLSASKVDKALAGFVSKMAKWVVIVLGVISCLGIFGVQTASFAAILASAGFAVGMALQGTLGNFASGVMLLIFKPFKPGQVITVGGTTGAVAEIDLFSTMLDTPDNRRIVIPNGSVFGATIENVSHHPHRRVDVAVGTDYSADLDRTRKVLFEAINKLQYKIDEPESAVVLISLGASSIDWAVRAWVKTEDYWPAMDELTKRVKDELDSAGIGIPFPQMDINMPTSTVINGKSSPTAQV